jgi:uncharacterized protein YjaG (DUF416 family)
MMDLEELVAEQVAGLPKEKKLAFMLVLCERLIPAMDQFARETGHDGAIFRECLDKAWCHLAGNGGAFNWSKLSQQCLRRVPDTEDIDHPLTSEALDAALAIEAMVSFLADGDIDHVIEARDLARDTATFCARNIDGEDVLMQQELQRQVKDLQFLQSLPATISLRVIPRIKKHAGSMPALLPAKAA